MIALLMPSLLQVDPMVREDVRDDSSDNYDLSQCHRNPIYSSEPSLALAPETPPAGDQGEMKETIQENQGRVSINIKSPPPATASDGRPLKWPKTVAQKSTRYLAFTRWRLLAVEKQPANR